MIRIAIIDDEPDARETLHLLIDAYYPKAEIVGHANGVAEGFALICRESPDIVLLDIRMDDGSGFDLLDMFSKPKFKVIFTTAHDEYALRAFRYQALHYLLKPVTPVTLVEALDRAVEVSLQEHLREVAQFKESRASLQKDKVAIQSREGLTFLNLSDITYITADANYTWAYLHPPEKILLTKKMVDLEAILPAERFFRIHNSCIVNIRYIKKYLKDGLIVVMDDNTELSIARRRKEEFLEWLEGR